MSTIDAEKKKYVLVPPDGGWGYVIWFAVILKNIAILSFGGSFGILYNDFMNEIQMRSTSVTLLNSLGLMAVAIAGFSTGTLLKFMSVRKLAFLGATLYSLGFFCLIFATTEVTFYICHALLQSPGFGILFNISNTVINDYFVEKRFLSVSLTHTVPAFSAILAPLLIKWSLEEYGYKGTLIFISGVAIQTFVAAALMQPVSWHMKIVEISQEDIEEKKVLLYPEIKTADGKPLEKIAFDKIDVKNVLQEIKENVEEGESNKQKKISLIDMQFLKTFIFTSAAMGMGLTSFTELNFCLLLPLALYSMNWGKEPVALALSLFAASDLSTRIIFIFMNKPLHKIGSRKIYLIGLLISLITKLGMLWTENSTVMLIFITLMGISRSFSVVLPPLVVADVVPPEIFSNAFGVYMIVLGTSSLIFGPAIGAVRDLTNSYITVFYILTSFIAIVTIFWVIELCYKANAHKRK